jgi:capsid protein
MLLGDGEDGDGTNPNGTIEREFSAWAKAVDLAGKLRAMRMAKTQDGETFALLFSNANPPNSVKLDVKLFKADQVTTPLMKLPTPMCVDGIVFDEFGNPKEYHVLEFYSGAPSRAEAFHA